MGLAEKRARKKFQQESFARCVDEVHKIVGHAVDFEVEWDAFLEMSPEKAPSYWENTYLLPLIEALQKIAVDDIGQEALQEQLCKVKIRGSNDHKLKVTWHEGLLVLNMKVRDDSPVGAPGSKTFSTQVDTIYACLEEHLE